MPVFSSRVRKINFLHLLAVSTLFLVADLDSAAARHRPGASASRSAFARVQLDASGNEGTVIGGRPAGCPHNYCGCGLRMYLGISDKRFNLAWNWARYFPRTSAHAGAAAVRSGHVMLLESQVSGTVWMVRDYNSGRGLSRVHKRDVRGYVFVDPNAGQHLANRS
jgi:hypothetical protein